MNLFEIPIPPAPSVAENTAANLLLGLNQNLAERILQHRNMFSAFWCNPEATPDDILAALVARGSAGILLASASENIDHIGRLAALVGKKVTDFIPEDQWLPRRAFLPGPGGGFTLAPPAEGFDAWGNALPAVVEPEVAEPEA